MAQQLLHSNNDLFLKALSFLLLKKFSFVVFSKPQEQEIFILVESNQYQEHSFVIQSFDGNQTITLNGSIFKQDSFADILNLINEEPILNKVNIASHYMNRQEYEKYVSDIITEIEKGRFSKVVAARKKQHTLKSELSIAATYLKMIKAYPNAFVYFANTNLGKWMGASPELLLQKWQGAFHTVSLAGTKQTSKNKHWTNKERDEQSLVTDYIVKALEKNQATSIKTSELYTSNAGHIDHLKKDIYFETNEPTKIIDALHPTPAVCGIPTDESMKYILLKEKNSRELYTGYLGLNGENAFYYVNLRCMQIFEEHIDIYIGAGITKDSIPEKEWKETEEKSKVLTKMLTKNVFSCKK